ncbi:MAG: MFS transporter [Acidimicrobiia bacterium]|nr:MFS transporter [Acidimicrobiia bacterium]
MSFPAPPPADRPRHSLRASLAYLIAARLVLNTAHRFAYPFLPAISRGLGVTLEQGGLLMSARALAGLATPLAVATAGRGERRRRTLALGLALFVLGAAVTAASGVYAGAITGFALFGLAKPLFDISGQAYIADRTPYRRRGRYLALFETTWALALLGGAPAAGWLISHLGWRAPFWAVAGLALAALAALPWALDPDGGRSRGTTVPRLRLTRPAALILAAVLALMFSAEVSFVVFGAWLEDRFGLSLVALGGAATAIAVAELAGEGASFALTDRLGPRRSVSLGLIVCVVAFAALGPALGSLGGGLAVMVLAFFGFEFAIVSALPLATEVAPEARTRFLALLVVALSVSRALAGVVGPALFSWGGFAANSTASALSGALAMALVLGVREQPVSPAPPGSVPL